MEDFPTAVEEKRRQMVRKNKERVEGEGKREKKNWRGVCVCVGVWSDVPGATQEEKVILFGETRGRQATEWETSNNECLEDFYPLFAFCLCIKCHLAFLA